MRCPYCSNEQTRVVDSREAEQAIRRRRECLRCGLRFTTMERIQSAAIMVVKRDGRREEFNREKVMAGLRLACAKRPVSMEALEGVAEDVEREVLRLGRAEVPAHIVGEMVMERLRRLDRIAYVRFASVYRQFQDVESFQKEVETLLQAREAPPKAPLIPDVGQGQLALPINGTSSAIRKARRSPTSTNLRQEKSL